MTPGVSARGRVRARARTRRSPRSGVCAVSGGAATSATTSVRRPGFDARASAFRQVGRAGGAATARTMTRHGGKRSSIVPGGTRIRSTRAEPPADGGVYGGFSLSFGSCVSLSSRRSALRAAASAMTARQPVLLLAPIRCPAQGDREQVCRVDVGGRERVTAAVEHAAVAFVEKKSPFARAVPRSPARG